MNHGLDTDERVCFYEQEFYVLSNFSAFSIEWRGLLFDTSEHVYHWEKFRTSDEWSGAPDAAFAIRTSRSAHDALQIARRFNDQRYPNWDSIKVDTMRAILRAKASQHEYVRRKLLQTGDRTLVENSWRDGFWGTGPNGDGQNMLGKLWMEIRGELRGVP